MKNHAYMWGLVLVLMLNLAVWIAVLLRKQKTPEQPIRYVHISTRDTVEIVDTLILTKWKTRIDTVKNTTLLTQDDSLLSSMTKLSE